MIPLKIINCVIINFFLFEYPRVAHNEQSIAAFVKKNQNHIGGATEFMRKLGANGTPWSCHMVHILRACNMKNGMYFE